MVIYSLSSSINISNVRYIGYTKKPTKIRLREHLSESKTKRTHKDKWIQKELSNGARILIEEIDTAKNITELKKKEIHYILLFKYIGARLVNGTKGGDGVVGLIASDKLKEWNRITKSKRIYCFNYHTKTLVGEFISCSEMCRQLSINRSGVGAVLSGKHNYSQGYTFSYNGICPTPKKKQNRIWNKGISTKNLYKCRATPVIAFNDKERICFKSVNDACEYFKIKSHNIICRAIKNGRQYKNYYLQRDIKNTLSPKT